MTKEIYIEGMHCSGCVIAVRGTMKELGIKADISLKDKRAILEADNIDMKIVEERIKDIGFTLIEK